MTMTTPAGAAVSLPFPGLAALEKPLDPRFLSLQDRERIADLHSHGKSRRKIAEELGRAASTISRELARNSVSEDGYYAYAAQRA
ncbi:helix-turn-helix domain-containing protein, partial [Arthrobacter sp. ES3-54]|uniref:helix-turn-helix domain-containing protein n=1 Tax=Arthrobacter sp. ES3-54 TaxID=1502991 RepID=UPI002406B289